MKKFAPRIAVLLCLILVLTTLEARAGVAYPAVSLKVPGYKQTDGRWAHLEVGNSGKSIRQVGCAITALAMTESYRTGKAVSPAAMENRLSFDRSGALYWPKNYTLISRITFAQLYQKLKDNVPVIIGARNARGDTHFVVVRGFVGGNKLSAAGFVIHDPGSSTRTRLSQFLAEYPTVYRRVFYTG